MTRFLDVEDVLEVAEVVLDQPAVVRDFGLLDAAVHRPRASIFGGDAYPDLFTKAGALLESLVRNHALVDGNKRLGWAATVVFLLDNGTSLLDVDQGDAYDFVITVAEGEHEVAKMAEWLAGHVDGPASRTRG